MLGRMFQGNVLLSRINRGLERLQGVLVHLLSRKFKEIYEPKSEDCWQNQISEEFSDAKITVENQRI